MYSTKDEIIDILGVILAYTFFITAILATIAASLYLFNYILRFIGM
jgi:preprotein translocase subunit SecE